MNILIIDDDSPVTREVMHTLLKKHHSVYLADASRHSIREALSGNCFEAIIFNFQYRLNDSSVELIDYLRNNLKLSTPILLLLSSLGAPELAAVQDVGVNDYIMIQHAESEVVARLGAMVRQAENNSPRRIYIGDAMIDLSSMIVKQKEGTSYLTLRETEILKVLLEHQGEAVNLEFINRCISPRAIPIESNLFHVHICNLRQKVPRGLIKTRRGIGYMIESQTESEFSPSRSLASSVCE